MARVRKAEGGALDAYGKTGTAADDTNDVVAAISTNMKQVE